MDSLIKDKHDFAVAYLDDLYIFSCTRENYMEHLKIILQQLHKVKLI